MTPEEAKAVLEAEKKERKEQVEKELVELLEKNNCILSVSLSLRGTQIIPNVELIAQ